MSSKINLQTCEYACKSSIFQDNQLISTKSYKFFEIIFYYFLFQTASDAQTSDAQKIPGCSPGIL